MKGYWIVKGDVSNFEGFKEYTDLTPDIITVFGGKFLIRAGKHEVVEGTSRSRNTIIEFPSYEQAMKCWYSAEYQEARKKRLAHSDVDIVVVEGFTE